MSTGPQRRGRTLAAVRQLVRVRIARRWPGRAAETRRRQPGCTQGAHTWRQWRRDTVEGRPIKLDVCKSCDAVRVQDDRRRRAETSWAPYVRRTLFYVPGPDVR